MMTTLTENQQPLSVIRHSASIHKSVERIKRNENRWGWHVTRRPRSGMPLETVFYVTPAVLDGNDLRVAEDMLCATAITRYLSRKRISFSLDSPLMERHVVATFDLIDDESVSLVIEIKGQRFRANSWYHSGGKLLGVVETPDFLK